MLLVAVLVAVSPAGAEERQDQLETFLNVMGAVIRNANAIPATPPPPASPSGALLVIEDDIANRQWNDGTPEIVRNMVSSGSAAFRSTGNNHFFAELGTVGDQPGQFRFIEFDLFLMDADADIQLQIQNTGNWGNRWGFDAEPAYNGYGWSMRGATAGLASGRWLRIRKDLVLEMGMQPGERVTGLAFSSDNADALFDRVMLLPTGAAVTAVAASATSASAIPNPPPGTTGSLPASGLVAYYPFHGDARDASGQGNDGIVNGGVLTADRFGNAGSAYHLNGAGNAIGVPHAPTLGFASSLTIAAWIRTTDPFGAIAVQHYGSNDGNFLFGLTDGGKLVFGRSAGFWTSAPVNDGTWHHVAGVIDGINHTVRHYVDGTLVAGRADADRLPNRPIPLTIGDESNRAYGLEGDFDEVCLYNRPLSDAEIRQLYTARGGVEPTPPPVAIPPQNPSVATTPTVTEVDGGRPAISGRPAFSGSPDAPEPGLVAYYPFEGDLRDASGNRNHGTATGQVTFDEGPVGGAAFFDGQSFITVRQAPSLSPRDQLTMAFWIRIDGVSNTWAPVVSKGGPRRPGWSNREYAVLLNYRPYLLASSAGDGFDQVDYASDTQPTGEWFFCAVILDRKNHTASLYINDRLVVANVADPYSSFNNSERDLRIGGTEEDDESVYPPVHSPFQGALDDLRIYSRALSRDEVIQLYRRSGNLVGASR